MVPDVWKHEGNPACFAPWFSVCRARINPFIQTLTNEDKDEDKALPGAAMLLRLLRLLRLRVL